MAPSFPAIAYFLFIGLPSDYTIVKYLSSTFLCLYSGYFVKILIEIILLKRVSGIVQVVKYKYLTCMEPYILGILYTSFHGNNLFKEMK